MQELVTAAEIMRQRRFSETPVRDQARVLGAYQDPVWSVGYRGGGGEAARQWQHLFSARSSLTPAPCHKAGGIEEGT